MDLSFSHTYFWLIVKRNSQYCKKNCNFLVFVLILTLFWYVKKPAFWGSWSNNTHLELNKLLFVRLWFKAFSTVWATHDVKDLNVNWIGSNTVCIENIYNVLYINHEGFFFKYLLSTETLPLNVWNKLEIKAVRVSFFPMGGLYLNNKETYKIMWGFLCSIRHLVGNHPTFSY